MQRNVSRAEGKEEIKQLEECLRFFNSTRPFDDLILDGIPYSVSVFTTVGYGIQVFYSPNRNPNEWMHKSTLIFFFTSRHLKQPPAS